MTPYKQLVKHNPPHTYGDCMRTAIGCVLDLPPEEVPHFFGDGEMDGDVVWSRIEAWLSERGLFSINMPFTGELADVLAALAIRCPHTYYLLGVASDVADHMVVGKGGKIVHDPAGHDSSTLKVGSDGYVWWYLILPKHPLIYEQAAEYSGAVPAAVWHGEL